MNIKKKNKQLIQKAIKIAIKEVTKREWARTEQLLKIHELVYENDKPKVLRVITKDDKNTAVVYFQIKDQRFYLAIYFDTKPKIAIRWIGTQPYHCVYFSASSNEMSYEEICKLTILAPTGGWNKGDKKKYVEATHKYTRVTFEPDPGPNEFETKMRGLLDFLETDVQGVANLVDKAEGYIQVATIFHNGNTMLGGHHLEKSTIARLAKLNLEIDFDEYAEGKFYID